MNEREQTTLLLESRARLLSMANSTKRTPFARGSEWSDPVVAVHNVSTSDESDNWCSEYMTQVAIHLCGALLKIQSLQQTVVTLRHAVVAPDMPTAIVGLLRAGIPPKKVLAPLEAEPLAPVDVAGVGLEHLVKVSHGDAQAAGWWTDLATGAPKKRNVGELLCLIHSEISEAMEAHRKGKQDDKLPARPGIEVELADAVIRIADLAGGLGLDLAGAVVEKLEYNRHRADHKPENRMQAGGKAY